MGGEDQLKALIRQAFREKNVADSAVLGVDALLARAMRNVRRLVETLPEESLLRNRAWRELEPLVKIEMEPYAQGLQRAVMQEETIAAPGMEAFAKRQAEYAGASITQGLGGTTPASVAAQVNRVVIGKARFEQLFAAKDGPSIYTKSMFKVVDRAVRAGIIEGLTTEAIADQVVHETISRGVPGVSLRGKTSVRQIRAQAMAMTRTVTADVSRQVREDVYAANAEALRGSVYQFTSALDSKTCPTCAVLDGQRWDNEDDAPVTPIHPNCRCRVLAIDPKDPFWSDQRKNSQRLYAEEPRYKGVPISKLKGLQWEEARNKGFYKTKVKVKGEYFWRRSMPFEGNYADRLNLKNSNRLTREQFFGSKKRTDFFEAELKRRPKDDPQQILVDMLNTQTQPYKFIPVP